MSRFVDEYAPDEMKSFNWVSAPTFSTQLTAAASGSETANKQWKHPRRTFNNPQGVREWSVVEGVQTHFLVMGGPYNTWPLRDPLDFASRGLPAPNTVPAITAMDQAIGTGDGFTTSFQLVKLYARGAATYQRVIDMPVVSTVLVGVGGVAQGSGWSCTRRGGVVTFDVPPPDGAAITAGFLFDLEVRFEADDSYQGMVRSYMAGAFADISLVQVPSC